MFEDLQRLYESFILYKDGQPYRLKQSKLQMDCWAEDKAAKMENESAKKNMEEVKREIGRVGGPKFYKRHLLNSIN
jgi:hypothetical protein